MQKNRLTPLVLAFLIFLAAISSRFIGGSDYLLSVAFAHGWHPYADNYPNLYPNTYPYNQYPYNVPTSSSTYPFNKFPYTVHRHYPYGANVPLLLLDDN